MVESKQKNSQRWFDVHADDYALSMNASREIIECIKDGKIDSISVMPNMSCFDSAIKMLNESVLPDKMPKYSVHLNFMEGHCLSDVEEVSELVDAGGFFKVSWTSLVFASVFYGRRRHVIKLQLKKEIKHQIERVKMSILPEWKVRIDSHQHTHMIPVVFDALTEVICEENYDLEYIRIPEEPQWPFLINVSLWHTYSPINVVKNVILNIFAKRNRRIIRTLGLPHNLLWGLLFSGKMDRSRVESVWPYMMRYIKRKKKKIEIVFHPGKVHQEEIGEEYVKAGFVEFHLSEWRDVEKEAIHWIGHANDLSGD